MQYIIPALTALVAALIFFFIGMRYRKLVAEKEIGSAEEEARRLLNDAMKQAESKKREALVEAKEEIHKNRKEFDSETKERRTELQRSESRLQQREATLDKKYDNLEKKEELLQDKLGEADKVREEVSALKTHQMEMLERISGLTSEDAKNYLINTIEGEISHEMAMKITELESRYKETADQKARDLISLSIQRLASDFVSETTVSTVALPNDEMKGRIIGREGRNIKAIETLTGVDLIIDDTPEAITLSCFDPVRREIARLTLEKLIVDGRIHPARIEETVEKSRKEIDLVIRSEGERATFETNVTGLHPDLIRILGRLKYRTSFQQNVLTHSIEVALIAGILATELGLDPALARRAGLLHDIGKAVDHEIEGTHVSIGVDLAKKYRENNEIIHAIQAHHGDVEATTIVAILVQAADAISAARPGARRENLEAYIKRLEKLEEIANEFEGVEKSFAIQAGREIRIIVNPDIIDDDKLVILARELAKKIENDLTYPGQVKVNMVREKRAIEYAK